MTAGVSNVSFGLPDRKLLTHVHLASLVSAGVECRTVELAVLEIRQTIVAADLLSGHDRYVGRYLAAYRAREAAQATTGGKA